MDRHVTKAALLSSVAIITQTLASSNVAAQGCEPIRFTTPVNLGGQGDAYQRGREWQLTLAYRRLVSNEWFVGTEENSSLAPGGEAPVFRIHTFVADVAYALNDRYRLRQAPPSGPFWAVPDVYSARLGGSFSVLPEQGLTLSLGARVAGIPVHDLLGGGDDDTVKRSSRVVFADPGAVVHARAGHAHGERSVSRARQSRKEPARGAHQRAQRRRLCEVSGVPELHASTLVRRRWVLTALTLIASVAGAQPVRPGARAPEIDLPTITGGRVQLSKLRGHPVVVSFWGTWCPPCRMEFPELVKLHQAYDSLGLRVLGVNGRDQGAARRRCSDSSMNSRSRSRSRSTSGANRAARFALRFFRRRCSSIPPVSFSGSTWVGSAARTWTAASPRFFRRADAA